MNKRILVVAAHPDDEVLGCGGTMARMVKEKNEVFVAILGQGFAARCSTSKKVNPTQIKKLQACSRKVAALIGIKDVFLFDFPDNQFDTVPLLDITKTVEEVLQKIKPEVVYTQHGGDLNIDHAVTFRATMTATRPMASPVRKVYAYEVASSSEWAFQQFGPVFHPNIFVDISLTLELKIEAMLLYESEIRSFPHPRSKEALRAAAMRWGSVAGIDAAEAFQCIREIL